MHILCITHADFETPGIIEDWAKNRNHSFKIQKPYKGEVLAKIDEFDFLILKGGPQSPTKIEEFPYLNDEIVLAQNAISQNKKVLGFCLGAQIIGESLGAGTLRSPEKEVGVYPITLLPDAENDPVLKDLPTQFSVIHWHNDMPGLTDSAIVLAQSEGCPRQIVRYNQNTYGFQCHLEITLDGIKTMIDNVPEDLEPSKFTQTESDLLAQDYESINHRMFNILDNFVQL